MGALRLQKNVRGTALGKFRPPDNLANPGLFHTFRLSNPGLSGRSEIRQCPSITLGMASLAFLQGSERT